jgi:histidinol-phosphate/aromatic aminotransferase/cobyric acid decarboxylase-like protein
VEEVLDSNANFILLRVQNADELVKLCADRSIRIRNFNTQPQLRGCVRLTIGNQQEMAEVKSALQAYGERA